MSFCNNCGKELVPGAKFCFECGTPVIYNQYNDNSPNTKRKVVFEGDIHKCPNCGEVLSSFVLNCPTCGHEIRGVATSKAIREFTMRLDKAESPSEKVSIIRNYTVPNTKEDIYEFMILASSNIGAGIEMELANAWESKLDQVIKKSKLIMHGQDEYRQLKEIYCQVIEKLNKKKKRENIKKLGGKLSELVPVLPNAIMVFGWLISLVVILVLCIRVSDKRGYQLLFMADFIVGAFWVPFTFKGGGVLTKLLTTAGLILSTVLLIPLCGKNVDNVGFNGYQLLLIVDFACCARIISQMIKKKSEPVEGAENTNGISFFVTIACVLVLVVIYGIGNILPGKLDKNMAIASGKNKKNYYDKIEKIVWKDFVLGENLPDFKYDKAEIVWDTENVLLLYFYDTNKEKYKSYVEECKAFGYTIDQDNSSLNFMAYNKEGYHLHLQYWDDESNKKITIDLDNPVKKNPIIWPYSELVKNVPIPENLVGEVYMESDKEYAVSLTDVEPEYFTEYVSQCQRNGFNIDYSKSDTYFSAKDKNGTSITIEYKGFNTLSILLSKID